jgi:hypothetical protein
VALHPGHPSPPAQAPPAGAGASAWTGLWAADPRCRVRRHAASEPPALQMLAGRRQAGERLGWHRVHARHAAARHDAGQQLSGPLPATGRTLAGSATHAMLFLLHSMPPPTWREVRAIIERSWIFAMQAQHLEALQYSQPRHAPHAQPAVGQASAQGLIKSFGRHMHC